VTDVLFVVLTLALFALLAVTVGVLDRRLATGEDPDGAGR
jgi:hypothetical protein